ncbi:hypothetical protein HDV06_001640 [Boothiomyces sp. JEL0866]|nr:hypothetical protein HDV06_001640 [Boothiomyces sp. JEL0866]
MEETVIRANACIGQPLNVGVISMDLPATARIADEIFIAAIQKTVIDNPHLVFGNKNKELSAKKLSEIDLEYIIQDAPKVFSTEVMAREELNAKIKSALGWRIRAVQGKLWIKESIRVVSLYVSVTSEFHVLDGYSTSTVLKQLISNLRDISKGTLLFNFKHTDDIFITPKFHEKVTPGNSSIRTLLISLWLVYQHFQKSAKTIFYGRPRKETAQLESYDLNDLQTECRLVALTPKELYAVQEEIKNTNTTTTAYLTVALLASYRGMMDTVTKKPAEIKPQSFMSSILKIIPIAFMIALCAEFGMESTAWFTCLIVMLVFFYFPRLLKEPRIPNYQNFTVVLDKRRSKCISRDALGNYASPFSYFMYKLKKKSFFWENVAAMKSFLGNCQQSLTVYEEVMEWLPRWLMDDYICRAYPNIHRDYSFMLSFLGSESWNPEVGVNDYFFGTNALWTGNRHVMQLSACIFENRMNLLVTYPSKLVEKYQVDIFIDSLRQVINNSIYDQKITIGNTLN